MELEPQFSAASLPKQNSVVSSDNVQVAEAEVLAVVGTEIRWVWSEIVVIVVCLCGQGNGSLTHEHVRRICATLLQC